ncbi:PhzF family phenazine biosynthesis protein [Peptoniphilus mikwangii]|uniref:PhzF family phenazine biosynthesis protein n=1 Tax=Peptoniphilus mikwangii TaxID=1354300 RepID=UPI00040CB040|nr:PhzF family phenazine biosynthesis protein [Peptoniphilus mikwangii]
MMRYFNMYLANAFTNKAFNGNATGVVISGEKMTDEEMQNTARDLNLSETVFINRIDVGEYYTRFFTPNREIDLCGHATIATFYSICENEYIIPIENGINKIIQHTKYGKIPVELEYEDGKIKNVYMLLKTKEIEKTITNEEIADALNISIDEIGIGEVKLEPKKITTGSYDIVVPLKSVHAIEKLNPNFEKIKELSEREKVISFQVFALEDNSNVRQRTFSPSIDVNEEAGSGTSTGATLYYINKNYSSEITQITSMQGIELNRKSVLTAKLKDEDTVRVGGRAFVFMNGVLTI